MSWSKEYAYCLVLTGTIRHFYTIIMMISQRSSCCNKSNHKAQNSHCARWSSYPAVCSWIQSKYGFLLIHYTVCLGKSAPASEYPIVPLFSGIQFCLPSTCSIDWTPQQTPGKPSTWSILCCSVSKGHIVLMKHEVSCGTLLKKGENVERERNI